MSTKRKAMTAKEIKVSRAAWERLTAEERQEVRRFISFLESGKSKANPRVYVNPLALALMAISQAETLRHEIYSFELLGKIVEHNRQNLYPALANLDMWATQIEKDFKQLEARKRKAGNHARSS
jgi:hypothetical protein